jgi:hypothetical protein
MPRVGPVGPAMRAVPSVPCGIAMPGPDFSLAINTVPPVPAVPARNRHSAGSDVIIAQPQDIRLHRICSGAPLYLGGPQSPLAGDFPHLTESSRGEQMPRCAGSGRRLP